MFVIAMIDIRFWRAVSLAPISSRCSLLIYVEVAGAIGMGAQRWIDLGFFQLQPSEMMKISLVMLLAAYSFLARPGQGLAPALGAAAADGDGAPVFWSRQPDLGTSIMLLAGGGAGDVPAGVSLWYFITAIAAVVGDVDHGLQVARHRLAAPARLPVQPYRHLPRPGQKDPLGAGYHITRAKIALGSGRAGQQGLPCGAPRAGWTSCRKKHTDFIFTTLAEEFGFLGAASALHDDRRFLHRERDRQPRPVRRAALTAGIGVTFFLFFAVNMGW